MRWLLPALTVSVALHGAMLSYVGPASDSQPGSDAPVSSTVIVFDTPPAPAVSASDGSEADSATAPSNAGSETDQEDEQAPPEQEAAQVEATPEPEPEPQSEPASEPEPEPEPAVVEAVPEDVEPAAGEAPEITVVAPVETGTLQATPAEEEPEQATAIPLPRAKPPLPDHVAERLEREKAEEARKADEKRKAEAARRTDEDRKQKSEARRKRQAERDAAKANAKTKAAIRGDGKGAKAGSRNASTSGSAGQKGGASAGDKRAYARRVLSHIQRFKRYPSGTSASGVVRLAVSISGSGALRSANVRGSSGHSALDRAAVATARAASPYPAPPGGGGFSFTVSLRFTR